MAFYFIFGFMLFFAILNYGYQFWFWLKSFIITKNKNIIFYNKKYLLGISLFIYGLITTLTIVFFTIFGLIMNNQVKNAVWSYLYIAFAFTNYLLIMAAIIWQSIVWNSLCMAVDNNNLYLMDISIPLTAIVGLRKYKNTYFLEYYSDPNLVETKKISGQQAINFLKNLTLPTK